MRYKLYSFLRQMLQEEDGGKLSSKKLWGHFVMLTVCISYVLSGFTFYKVNEALFDSMLLAGVSLLGLSMIAKFAPSHYKRHHKDES